MTKIDNDILDGVTGGTATTVANTANNVDRPTLHLLKKLGRELGHIDQAQTNSSNQMLMLMCAMFASRGQG